MPALPHGPVCTPRGHSRYRAVGLGARAWGGWKRRRPSTSPGAPHRALPLCRTERQHRDLSYCVSQLPLTERGLHKMLDNFECFGDKLSDECIFSAFLTAVSKLRRGAKPESKVSGAVCCPPPSTRCPPPSTRCPPPSTGHRRQPPGTSPASSQWVTRGQR